MYIYMHTCIHTYIDLYMFIGLHIYRVLWLIFIFSAENFPHFTLHSAKTFRTKVFAFYPLAIFRIPHFTLTLWHIVLNLVVIKNSLPHSSQLFSFIVSF